MNSVSVMAVHRDEVSLYWPVAKKHVEAVIARNPEYSTMEGVHGRFLDGSYIMILVNKGPDIVMAMAAEVVTCDTGNKILMIPHLGGEGMKDWLPAIVEALYKLADDLGCFKTMISGAREGWAKVMKKHGGVVSHVVIEFDTQKYLEEQEHGR